MSSICEASQKSAIKEKVLSNQSCQISFISTFLMKPVNQCYIMSSKCEASQTSKGKSVVAAVSHSCQIIPICPYITKPARLAPPIHLQKKTFLKSVLGNSVLICSSAFFPNPTLLHATKNAWMHRFSVARFFCFVSLFNNSNALTGCPPDTQLPIHALYTSTPGFNPRPSIAPASPTASSESSASSHASRHAWYVDGFGAGRTLAAFGRVAAGAAASGAGFAASGGEE
mmetsp:Transcript_22377/g.55398  ORF Transcript_22377/g.55398 Transcript_22377/m.55398 type:complete len:228 (-) Transcript_22377:1071-1754(-)